MTVAPLGPMFVKQVAAEVRRFVRVPAFSLTSLLLPIVFYAFIGLGQAKQMYATGLTFGTFFMASMGAYAVSNVMVFSFGIGVANERGQKIDLLMRATPLPAWVYLGAKTVSAMFFGLATLLCLFAFAYVAAGVHLGAAAWSNLLWRLMLGALPFIAAGFAIGYLAGPNSAIAVVNLLYLPTAFASGLFFPPRLLPDFIQRIAPYLPLYRYGQLAWNSVGLKTDPVQENLLYLAVYAAVFFVIALRAYRWEESRKFS